MICVIYFLCLRIQCCVNYTVCELGEKYRNCIKVCKFAFKSYLRKCSIPWDFLYSFFFIFILGNRPYSYRPSRRGLAKICFVFLKIIPPRCINFSNLFLEWNSACFGQFLCPSSGVFHCTHSNGICHTSLYTACKQEQDGRFLPDPAFKLSANLYDIYYCCVYSQKLLTMYGGTVRNVKVSFQSKIK